MNHDIRWCRRAWGQVLALGLVVWFSLAATVRAQEPREFATRAGNRVWYYRPARVASDARVPCILVGAAGSRFFHGMKLADGDRPEHLPYVEAGFAVAAFEISGAWNEQSNSLGLALRSFLAADLGVKDALEALDLVQQNDPTIDPERVFIAGHSSAGALALRVAAASPRVKACIAYAPAADYEARFTREQQRELDALAPGATRQLLAGSPARVVRNITCPVFLFHAADDERVSYASVAGLEKNMRAAQVNVTFVKTETGGHYDAMTREGIPAAIKWLKQLE